MKLRGARVLITGGAGFIGSHLVEGLLWEGASVGVIDDFSTGAKSNLPTSEGLDVYEGDIRNLDFVRSVVHQYDAVLHEAARVSVPRSVEDPLTTDMVNTTGTLNMLVASKDARLERFVYASSSSVYGDTPTLPKSELMPPNPFSPYAVSKLAGENYCRTFGELYGLKTVCLRYFNVYGPRQKAGAYSGVIPAFVKRALDKEPLLINGDGTQTRDFTYVKDVVQANLLCLKKDLKGGEVYNVGSHQRTSLNDLANLIRKLTGTGIIEPVHGPPRPGDIAHSYADITKISSELGYAPAYGIESGLASVIDWSKSGNNPP